MSAGISAIALDNLRALARSANDAPLGSASDSCEAVRITLVGAVDFIRERVIHGLEIQDSLVHRFRRENTRKDNYLVAYRLQVGMGTATSWNGFGYVLEWLRLRLGMA